MSLVDDGNNLGIWIADGGKIGIGTKTNVNQSMVFNAAAPYIRMDISTSTRGGLNVGQSSAINVNCGKFEYDVASSKIFIKNGTTDVMTLTSGAYVGIGTTAPGSNLDVKGTLRLSGSTSGYVGLTPAAAAGSTTYTLPSADGSSGQFLSTNGSGTLSWSAASGGSVSQWTTSSSNIYYNTGYIGIGTSTPVQLIHIQKSSSTAAPLLLLKSLDNNSDSANPGIIFEKQAGSPTSSMPGAGIFFKRQSFGSGDLYFCLNYQSAWADQTLDPISDAKMVLKYYTGNLGLGTTAPSQKLHIAGGSIQLDTGYSIYFGNTSNLMTGNSSSNYLAFSTNASERMRIISTGNVGIGTSNPGSALDVKGSLRLSGSSSGYVGLTPAAAAGSTTYTLPSADGSSGQFLSTNGAGTLS